MVLKKDKAKVLDEVWTEDRIRGFLDVAPAAGYPAHLVPVVLLQLAPSGSNLLWLL